MDNIKMVNNCFLQIEQVDQLLETSAKLHLNIKIIRLIY